MSEVKSDIKSNLPINFDTPKVCLFIGRPRSGKTKMLTEIFRQYKDFFSFGITYSKTSQFSGDLDFLPQETVIEDFDLKKFTAYINGLKKMKLQLKKQGKEMPRSYIIWDDMLGKVPFYDSAFANFLACYRHYNVYIFLTAQYLAGASATSTLLREITSYSFIWSTQFYNSIKAVYQMCGSTIPKLKEFRALLNAVTNEKPYQCLMYDSSGRDLHSCYKAVLAPNNTEPFKVEFKK